MSNESFATLFEESFLHQGMKSGEIITAEVLSIDRNFVIVNAGLKSESIIDIKEFETEQGDVGIQVGDFVKVYIESLEDGYGSTKLSREKAKRIAVWNELEQAMNEKRVIKCMVGGRTKGGLMATINGVRAFLPGSLVDIHPVKDITPYENKEWELQIIKIDKKRNNVVVSRKAVLEERSHSDRSSIIEIMKEGAVVKGIVKNVMDYGVFVDLGGIDGLLHITDIAWKRIKHPSELLAIGDEITAKVLKFDHEKNRVSLGLKQFRDDPWAMISRRYPVGTRLFGKISNLTDYGAFVEIESGMEGLVHISEMDWTNKNINPEKIFSIGDEVEVMIIEIDEQKRRLSLGIKQCIPNPWEDFSENHKKGDRIEGVIKSITDFGVFVGLEGNIDGLIHLSDLSWDQSGEEAIREFKKGMKVEAIILGVDVEKERISLGIKQAQGSEFQTFAETNKVGSSVASIIEEVTPKGIKVKIDDKINGFIRTADFLEKDGVSVDSLKKGDELIACITGADRRKQLILLKTELGEVVEKKPKKATKKTTEVPNEKINHGTTSLGALLKAKIEENKNK